jgi:predicted Zn-dependent peptidase
MQSHRLSNGMRVVIEPDRRVPLVAIHLCYLSGSRHEPRERCGLAHLCEHFTSVNPGGGPRRVYSQWIEEAGGLANGSTLHDQTSYSASLPSHQLRLGLWAERRRMTDPPSKFTRPALEVQRSIVREERRARVDNRPYGRSYELLQALLYPPDHPYSRPPAGSPEGVRSVDTADVEGYFLQHYTPDNAVLALAGDLSPDEGMREVERYFGDIPAGGRGRPAGAARIRPEPPPSRSERREVVKDHVPFARTYLAYRAPGYKRGDWHAASLYVRSLGVGRSSPLRRKLVRERQVAQGVQAYMVSMREESTVAFVATAAPGVECQRVEDALVEAVDELLVDGLPRTAVRRAQKKALTDHYSAVQNLNTRAEMLASATAYLDDPALFGGEAGRYLDVEPDELMSVGRKLCEAGGRAVLSMVPRGDRG